MYIWDKELNSYKKLTSYFIESKKGSRSKKENTPYIHTDKEPNIGHLLSVFKSTHSSRSIRKRKKTCITKYETEPNERYSPPEFELTPINGRRSNEREQKKLTYKTKNNII